MANKYTNTRHDIKDRVIHLLITTRLSSTEIGKLFGLSRGPVSKIYKEHKIKRPFHPRCKFNNVICKTCNTSFYPRSQKKKRNKKGELYRNKFCSRKCFNVWQTSDDNKQSNHPRWKENREEISHIWSTQEWKDWKKQVYERDNHTCQLCFSSEKNLNPHHILYRKDHPELTFDVNNGIVLCRSCHSTVHWKDEKREFYQVKFQNYIGSLKASLIFS